ncbi:2-polyprenyl-6-methoxyphenol hydroxylase-like FAD-dependent oxidoreductase [Bradyrhizobium sp. USDA 4461]
MAETRPVLIAGGGIGGLAVALGLAQKGIRSILLEKAAALGEIGAGIQLGPNAFHAFDYLGVGEAARNMAVYIDQLRLMDALTADEITHIDLGDAFRARFGNPYAVVHRGDLHGVFLRACERHELIELRVSSEVVGYEQDGSSVTARLGSGERVTGRLLIGADGLWSNIRKQVTADGPRARLRPHHLSFRDPDRADAGGSALERSYAVGRPEMPHRALSAVGLEGVQPRRHLSQRRAGAGRRQAGLRGRGDERLHPRP